MYRIVLIGDAGSIHVKKWVIWYLEEGHDVLQITTRHLKECEIYNTNIRFLPDPENKLFPGSWTLIRKTNPFRTKCIVNRYDPDIVHVHRVNDELNLLVNNHPLIMNAWGSEVYQVREGTHGYRAVKKNLKRADMILGTTPDIVRYLHNNFNVDPGMMKAWSWGIDTSLFSIPEDKNHYKKMFGYSEEDILILSPRGISDIYRNSIIVRGFMKAYKKNNSLKLIILGNNPHKNCEDELMNIIGEKGHPGIRIIREKLGLKQVSDIMKASDFYIGIPRSDQLSSALLESMACGCIPIVSDLPAYRGTVSDNENGYVLKEINEKRILQLLLSLTRRTKEHEIWRERNWKLILEHHNWTSQARKMMDVYDELTGST